MGKLIYDAYGDIFYWYGPFSEKHVPKQAGFSWNKLTKHWEAPDVYTAANLGHLCDVPTARALAQKLKVLQKQEQLSQDTGQENNVLNEIPVPKGLSYRPYQQAGITYAMMRKNTYIADPTGVGKTVQALGVCNAAEAKRVLIVCPASVKYNWFRHAEQWLVWGWNIIRVSAKTGWNAAFNNSERLCVIVNYDIINRYPDRLREHWDVVIADESQALKNDKSQRSRAFYKNIVDADKILFLSATPLKNHPIELWPQISFLDPKTWHYADGKSKYVDYAIKYCGAHQDGTSGYWVFKGEPSVEDLHELESVLRRTIMIRRNKADVLTELPPKQRQIIEIAIDEDELAKILQYETAVFSEQKAKMSELKANVVSAKYDDTQYKEAVKRMNQGYLAIGQNIAQARKKTAIAKVPYMIEFIKEALESEDQLVVFAHHREVLLRLLAEFKGEASLLFGGMNENRKQEELDKFRNHQTRIFLGSILASGLGLNDLVQAGCYHAMFAELTYVPSDISQAEDRLWRDGAKNPVLIQQVMFPNSIDYRLANIIVKKQEILDAVLDHGENLPEDFNKSVLKELLEG